jgi:hypothetical protein
MSHDTPDPHLTFIQQQDISLQQDNLLPAFMMNVLGVGNHLG